MALLSEYLSDAAGCQSFHRPQALREPWYPSNQMGYDGGFGLPAAQHLPEIRGPPGYFVPAAETVPSAFSDGFAWNTEKDCRGISACSQEEQREQKEQSQKKERKGLKQQRVIDDVTVKNAPGGFLSRDAAVAVQMVIAATASAYLTNQPPQNVLEVDCISLPSLGSVAHDCGTCHPCHYAHSTGGCRAGKLCGLCHYRHPRGRAALPVYHL
mmetsp:Transcript_40609/g.88770  ORF Transcript_40609/g.88770 Transcript_40609/m.88770 type:complete len:212 (-) Transcript_40609:101-736(-)